MKGDVDMASLRRTDIIERKEEILQWIAKEQPKCYIAQ